MNTVRQLIAHKLEHLETISAPALQEVLNFVNNLELRLETDQKLNVSANSTSENSETEDTSSFLLEIAESFADNLTNEDLEYLPTDGATQHDLYLYNMQR
jgi:hypothetical protein